MFEATIQRHVGRQRYFFLLRFLLQNRDLGLQIGRLNVGDQSPLEAAAQPVFDLGQFLGRAIAGNHDLLHRLVQRVEGVEELFLRALFAASRNWMSSISSTSTLRNLSRKLVILS